MPRPKRQRPKWLPRWMPFKDGRILGLARQTILSWISLILALFFFAWTVAYASKKSRLSDLEFVYKSKSKTILVLRVLSEAASLFLATTIHSTFEVIQWVLISRATGIGLPQFLALQSSTGPLGLIVLALGKGLPRSEWPLRARLMPMIRLLAEVTIPVLAVLVMSNVNTDPIYLPISGTTSLAQFGMVPFNASVASQLGVMEDLLFNINYFNFLVDSLHAIDITPPTSANKCAQGVSLSDNTTCTRRVLITQELQNVDANLGLTQHPESDVVVSQHQQIYQLEYKDNVAVPKENSSCLLFASGPSQYRFCAGNVAAAAASQSSEEKGQDGSDALPPPLLHISMTPCPNPLVLSNQCTLNTTWHNLPGFSASLSPSFANATIAYDRQRGSIISHSLETTPIPTPLNASDILTAMSVLLNVTVPFPNSPNSTEPADANENSNPILGSTTHFFGRLAVAQMYRVSTIMATNPTTARYKGVNALQCFLAITLFYCQNGILSQTVLPFAPNATATQIAHQIGAYQKQNKTSTVALASTHYQLRVGKATLIAYIILSGLTLLVCLVALVVGSVLELAKFDAEPTLWPSLDFYTQCRVEDGVGGKVVGAKERVELAWVYRREELFRRIRGLRVVRRKRKMKNDRDGKGEGAVGGEDELPGGKHDEGVAQVEETGLSKKDEES